ncbi:MAG: hypothetical protein V2J16_08645 [Thermoleophilia bacterium]|jgi:hypothetical protein|nr:hypothetical protein [Thermoleophilia bacterium]
MASGRAAQAAYGRLAELGLVIDGYETERHELDVSSGFRRVTTTVVLHGGGHEGRGEDVTYVAEDHDGFPLDLPLSGHSTFDEYSRRLGELDLFPAGGPTMAGQETYRRWAFESAALDLALRQAGVSLGAALGREYRPVRFVVSTRLDIRPWLEVDPELEFKLDPTPEWDADTMARIAATGRVRALDFKAYYEGTPVDNAPDAELYRAVATAFPGALLEDPALGDDLRAALCGEEGRFSFDAPIHSWADVEALPVRPRHLNVKPSRFGSLGGLLETVERAQAEGIELYGGGQFELGIGRDQIQALASLFYAGGPNDVAPRDYHGEARGGVPRSPLVPLEQDPGFGFTFQR